MKLQIRVSPRAAKTQIMSNKKYAQSGTVVPAVMENDSYVESTDVSSPIRAASRDRKGKNRAEKTSNETEHGDAWQGSDGSGDEGFETLRGTGRRSTPVRTRSPLGPPITSDQRMADLNEIHGDFVQQFVLKAKAIEEKIRNGRGRKKPYFTEENFREMAIDWTLSVKEMMGIRHINTDNVKEIGKRFLPCLAQLHEQYEKKMRKKDDRDIDENHQNVIDLVTDEEDGDSDFGQESEYFQKSAEVKAFNEKVAQANAEASQRQTQISSSKPKSRIQPTARGNRGGSSFSGNGVTCGSRISGRGDFRREGWKGSGGFSRARSVSRGSRGISKRKGPSKRPSNGSTASGGSSNIFKSFARKTGGGGGTDGGFGSIGIMPT